jgi:hypothetical protein
MKVVLAFVLGALVVPAAVQARTASSEVARDASLQCSALRAKVGPSTFGATFASFPACVLKFMPLERRNSAAAATVCRPRFPGTSSVSRPFVSCVVSSARISSLVEQHSLDPVRRCTAVRADALGDCVSRNVAAQVAAETSASATCRVQQTAGNFAAVHDGRTFARFYGTGTAGANAFGRCVSLTSRSVQVQQSASQSSSSTSTTTTSPSTDNCSGGSALGKPNRLMPSDCLPAAPG